MCGIAGAVAAFGADLPAAGRLEAAVRALRHRGPDGAGRYVAGAAALGHTRLSIIDVGGGAQPMASEDGSVVTVFNGEVWNHRDLRRRLERSGHRFATNADTEVLVHGYEEWGDGLLERLDGMFAFAIWDARSERLLLARDRVGKKPLYVVVGDEGVAFGSDARTALLVSGRRPEVDEEHVAEFLFQRYVGAPRTLFRGIEKLSPGTCLVYDRRRVDVRRYWRLRLDEPRPLEPSSVRDLLRDSVGRRLMSDVPVGVLLSGGVDSAAVVGLMHEAGAAGVASFTIGFEDAVYDERALARLVARRYGTDHHELVVRAEEFSLALARLAWYRDEPCAEPSEIPLLLVAELAGRHVKAVLSGDGGDELFGGYPKYRVDRLVRTPAARLLPRGLAERAVAGRRSHRRLGRAFATVGVEDDVLRWASWFRTFGPEGLAAVLARPLRPAAAPERLSAPLAGLLAPYRRVDRDRRMLVGDFLAYLPDNMLLRSDKVLMAASVEGRMPLLDLRLVEAVSNVRALDRAGYRRGKVLLRRAVADLVPDEVLRAPKRGFPVPVARFLLRSPGRSLERLLLSDRCLERGLLAPDAVRALVAAGPDHELELFTLVALELWCRANVDAVRLEPPSSLDDLGVSAEPRVAAAA